MRELDQRERDREVDRLWESNLEIIGKFFEIAERKISILDD